MKQSLAGRMAAPYVHGRLEAGDGHSIYWEIWGNPNGKPAVILHGGPGSGASSSWTDSFDLGAYRVVLFDQQGCGRSSPHAGRSLEGLVANTTEHLVGDLEALRAHLGIDRWLVMGASWGSVLGLAYAEAHPGSVSELVLFSVVGGTQREVDWATRGMGQFFPEEWRHFQAGVPEEDRDGDLSAAYYRLLLDPDPAVHELAARNWCEWDDRQMRAMAISSRTGPSPENAARLAGTPGVLIRGARDPGHPIDLFWHLAREWSEGELVVIDDEGHRGGPATSAALVQATDRFANPR